MLNGEKKIAESWNLGPYDNEFCNVEKVVNIAQKNWDKIEIEFKKNKKYHEAKLLRLNSSKAYDLLKWGNLWDINKTVKYTIDWYKSFIEKKEIITEHQIDSYVSLAQKNQSIWT